MVFRKKAMKSGFHTIEINRIARITRGVFKIRVQQCTSSIVVAIDDVCTARKRTMRVAPSLVEQTELDILERGSSVNKGKWSHVRNLGEHRH